MAIMIDDAVAAQSVKPPGFYLNRLGEGESLVVMARYRSRALIRFEIRYYPKSHNYRIKRTGDFRLSLDGDGTVLLPNPPDRLRRGVNLIIPIFGHDQTFHIVTVEHKDARGNIVQAW